MIPTSPQPQTLHPAPRTRALLLHKKFDRLSDASLRGPGFKDKEIIGIGLRLRWLIGKDRLNGGLPALGIDGGPMHEGRQNSVSPPHS